MPTAAEGARLRARLCDQLVVAAQAAAAGKGTITAADLARYGPGGPSQVRRWLRELGVSGKRGVGYDVDSLVANLADRLSAVPRRVALVGAGELAAAIAESPLLRDAGVRITCVFDPFAEGAARGVGGLEALPVEDMAAELRKRPVDAGVIATPAWAARCVHKRLSDAGVPLVVSFADVLLAQDAGAPVHHTLPAAGLVFSLVRGR